MQDAPDGRKKTHIQHAVRFVEHQYLHLAQVRELAGDEILQASRSGNDKLAAGAQTVDLRFLGYAADYQRRLRQVLAAQLFVLLVNLHGEFTRGQQDQGADVLAWCGTQHLDNRNQKRESLAGAGLGGANHVLAFKGRSNGFRLDGCKGNELSCRQFLLQGSRQGQFRKCGHSIVFFLEGLTCNFSDTCPSFACRSVLKLALEPNGGQEMAEV